MKLPFWKKAWFLVSVPMGLFLILFLVLFFRDIEPVEPPSHLAYIYPKIYPEDNFFVDFEQSLLSLEGFYDEFRSISSSNEDEDMDEEQRYFEFVQNTEASPPLALIELRKAILAKRAFLSFEVKSFDDALPHLGKMRTYAQYELKAMRYYASKNEWTKVSEFNFRLQQFFMKFVQSNSYIEGLVYVACENIYKSGLNSILDDYEIPRSFLEENLKYMNELHDWRELYRSALVAELELTRRNIIKICNAKLSFGSHHSSGEDWIYRMMRPNIFYKDSVPIFDFWYKAVARPLNKLGKDPLTVLQAKRKDLYFLFTHREVLLQLMMLPSLDSGSNKFRLLQTRRDLLKLRLASFLLRQDTGKLPRELDDLIPSYLSVIPDDCFNGGKLLYIPEKELFYSVGSNLLDEFGKYDPQSPHSRYADDIVRLIGKFPEFEEEQPQKNKFHPN